MQPSLLPDLAHLPVTLSVFGVALLAIGLGALAGARRAETALVSGWGIAAFVTVLAGTFLRLPLPPVMYCSVWRAWAGLAGRSSRAPAASRSWSGGWLAGWRCWRFRCCC